MRALTCGIWSAAGMFVLLAAATSWWKSTAEAQQPPIGFSRNPQVGNGQVGNVSQPAAAAAPRIAGVVPSHGAVANTTYGEGVSGGMSGSAGSQSGGGLIVLGGDAGESQQIVLIEPKSRVVSVYHVRRATGEISLKSVRSIQGDLQLEEFNSDSPSPREIRSLLAPR